MLREPDKLMATPLAARAGTSRNAKKCERGANRYAAKDDWVEQATRTSDQDLSHTEEPTRWTLFLRKSCAKMLLGSRDRMRFLSRRPRYAAPSLAAFIGQTCGVARCGLPERGTHPFGYAQFASVASGLPAAMRSGERSRPWDVNVNAERRHFRRHILSQPPRL